MLLPDRAAGQEERTKYNPMQIKRILGAACAAILAGTLAGCGTMVSVNPEKDEQQVVAEVNGTPIEKSAYYDMIDTYGTMYGMSVDDLNDDENGAIMRESILEQLVNEEALYQQAVEDGLVDDSEEHREEVRKELQDSLDATLESYKEQYDTEEEAQEAYEEYVKDNGYDDMDAKIDESIRQTAINDEYAKITDPVAATEEDAKEYYDEQVEIQQEAIDEDPTSYSLYTSQGENFYNPKGSVYVKNLLISLPDDVQSEISSLRAEGDTEAADALRDQELAKIKAEADAALARANAGEDFDALLEELGTDPGMTQEPAKTTGYMVYEGSNYVEPFEEASLLLTTDGQISPLVPTDFGYHIIERVTSAEGAVPFDDVKESIIESETSTKQSEAYQEFLDSLKDSMEIVLHTDRLEIFNR